LDIEILLGISLVVYLLVAPLIALIRSGRFSRKADALENANEALRLEVRGLTTRIYALENTIEKLGTVPAEVREAKTQGPAAKPMAAPPSVAAPPAKFERHIETPQPSPPIPIAPVPPAGAEPRPPIPHAPADSASSAAHTFMGKILSEVTPREKRNWADLEERLGANWLNKIGTAAFVIGVALLLNYSMHYLGAQGKIILGYTLSVCLLAVGVYGERNERYRIAARAVLGGGWALAYFTTYALHNIAAVRLVTSASLGFGLLFMVAVAMVAHSLRYNSEVTTGFAFLLTFASVAVSEVPMGGLVASALLAASLAVILRQRRWFAVEPFAIIATYAVHWMWLNQVYERIGGHKPFPEFKASVALVSAYWVIYLVSYFLRQERDTRESQLLTASFLLNVAGYLAVLHYQSFHPEWRFWFLLFAGAVYLGVSEFSRRIGRRLSFVLASTLGATLMIAAVPYRYSGGRLEILWLLEVEALLVVGWRILDSHLRKLAWVGAAILASYVFFHDLGPRFDKWAPPDLKMGWLLLALAVAFYVDGRLKDRLGERAEQIEQFAFTICPALATGFLLAAAWVALPFFWAGLIWIVTGVALVEASRPLRDKALWLCGHGAAFLAVVRLLIVNMAHDDLWHNVSLRLITVGFSCAIIYAASRRNLAWELEGKPPAAPVRDLSAALASIGGIRAVYTYSGTLLVALLLWDETTTAAVGLAWGLFALALLETAEALHEKPLLVQGRVLLIASFARIFVADLNSTSRVGVLTAPVITVTLLAASYYYAAFSTRDSPRFRAALLWFGTTSVAALLRFQLPAEWVAVSWAAMAVAAYALGRQWSLATFRNQCYVLTLFVGIRCAFDNFYQTSPWHFTNTRTATVVACSLFLYILFAVAQLSKTKGGAQVVEGETGAGVWKLLRKIWSMVEMYPRHLFFFVPTILLTVLLSLEVRRGYLTAAWGLEGLVVFLAVLKMDERSYRWFSLLLFLLCVGRIVTVDVWNLDALGRIVSFMGLGVALLAVSFLYARHRELLRRVL
jgi:uncharacterized membrane protein